MRDIVACFSHHAVKVAESTRSGCGGGLSPAFDSPSPPQSENTVCCSYRATLSSRKQLLIELTWRRIASVDAFLSVAIDLEGSATHRVILRKKKGSRAFSAGAAACNLHWDVSAAKFVGAASDPAKNFYLVIIADQELTLQLGDLSGHFVERMEHAPRAAEYCAVLYARRERVFGATHHSTKAVFRDGGSEHEVMVRCKIGEGGSEDAATGDDGELYFCVDRKRLIDVREVKLNFRGNRTIYLDGSAIDVLWDVHDWWFRGSASDSASSSGATFMFRTRSATESTLWGEEEMAKGAFTLLIQIFKN